MADVLGAVQRHRQLRAVVAAGAAVVHAAAAIGLLAVALGLSVYKPRGVTPWRRR